MFSDTDDATTSSTCLVETAWEYVEDLTKPTCIFTLSRWILFRKLTLWALPFLKLACQKNRDFQKIRSEMQLQINTKFPGDNEPITALEYMSDIFSRRNNKKMYYNITSAFFNALLFFEKYKNVSLDGLVYPSANTDGAGMNVALCNSGQDENS